MFSNSEWCCIRSTSLDQRAAVLKGGLPKTSYCPKRDTLTGTDCSSYKVPAAALLSCSRMNEGGPGTVARVGLCVIEASPLLPSHLLRDPVPQQEQCPFSPCVTWAAEAKTRTFLDAAQPQPLNKTKDMHCFTANRRRTNEIVLPSIREAACMAVHGGWMCGFHGVPEFMGRVWERPACISWGSIKCFSLWICYVSIFLTLLE